MSLAKYQKKRKFSKTPEPKGKVGKRNLHRFSIQRHQASHLHYDLRLEMDGVLKSWAVPKGISEKINEKRLAIQTEDHPVDYIDFEGIIPKGNYGAGTVELWDKGKYKLIEETEKSLKIDFDGEKIKGNYVLFNFKDKNWFLFRAK